MKKLALIMLVLFMAAACGGKAPTLQKSEALSNEYAYIVGLCIDAMGQPTWERITGDPLTNMDKFEIGNPYHHVYKVNPGTYGTTYVFARGGGHTRAEKGRYLATFEAKPGEIIYVGDFFFLEKNGRIVLYVEDNQERLQKNMEKLYPQVDAGSIKTQLMTSDTVPILTKE